MKKDFKCKRCGYCCSLNVKLSPGEIKEISNAGYKDFLDKKEKYLKKINGRCVFLKLDKGITSCTINNFKPSICKTFPIQKGFIWEYKDIRCRACRY